MAKPYSKTPRAAAGTSDGLGRVAGVTTADGQTYESPVVILAPGREGRPGLTAEAGRLGIGLVSNAVDIGVRVEVPAVVTDIITDELYEPKLLYTSRHFEDQVRTFCMNPRGVVCTECWGDAVTVNGHSYADSDLKTANTNFALLVSTRFTVPFKEPIAYGKSVARLANMLGRDILVQRLGDLRAGHRTTPERLRRSVVEPTLRAATPGDLELRVALQASARPRRHARCPGRPPAGGGRARHAAVRGGGQVLFLASHARSRSTDPGQGALRHRRRGWRHAGAGAGVRIRTRGRSSGAGGERALRRRGSRAAIRAWGRPLDAGDARARGWCKLQRGIKV